MSTILWRIAHRYTWHGIVATAAHTSRTVAGCFKNSLCVGDAFELATVAELAIEAGVEAMIRALEKEVLYDCSH